VLDAVTGTVNTECTPFHACGPSTTWCPHPTPTRLPLHGGATPHNCYQTLAHSLYTRCSHLAHAKSVTGPTPLPSQCSSQLLTIITYIPGPFKNLTMPIVPIPARRTVHLPKPTLRALLPSDIAVPWPFLPK
jgi:hypothetical protein